MKLSDYVMEFLVARGVEHVFMLSGGGAMHLNDSLGAHPNLEAICCLHEQACAIAAEASGKITNRPGVALVTTGPGGTNAVTGVAGAWLDSTPCMFLSGQVKRSDLKGSSGLRQLGVQEVDIVSIVKPVTKLATTITDPGQIRFQLEQAWALACHGRPGPVWIDIPLDVQASQINPEDLIGFDRAELDQDSPQGWLDDTAMKVIEMLKSAERPVLLVGNGIRLAGAYSLLHEVIDILGIPVLVATSLGIDLIHEDHPLFFGRPGPIAARYANFTLQNSDLLISVGARLDLAMVGYARDLFARGATKVQVDIDCNELKKSETPATLSVQADAGTFLAALKKAASQIPIPPAHDWIAQCRRWRKRYPLVLDQHREIINHVSSYHFTDSLCDLLNPNETVVTCSSGNAVELFHLVFKAKAGQRVVHTRGLGAMGFGLPAAIGACLASGRRRTICLEGDGGIQLNIQELETLRRLALPIKLFVINNNGYASIRISQKGYFDRLCGADPTSGVTLPSLERLAFAYSLPYAKIINHVHLREQLASILSVEGPLIVEVFVDPDEVRMPRMTSISMPDGSMRSSPLEDLWPFLDREEFNENMIVPPMQYE